MPHPSDEIWRLESPLPSGPLRGIRVLDLTAVIMGPSATMMLGDMGADVIKIENGTGDTMRWIGPFRHDGMGPMFLQGNRNKRSVMLDLKTPAGKAAILALAEKADVLISNVRPQGLARLGLDYDAVAKVNPKIIYCAAVGYGSDGPEAGKAVYDDLMQAASGICGLFLAIDGAPRYAPINLCDRTVGLYAANTITAALYHRAMTGEGQFIEVPMFETMAQFVLADHMGGAAFVPPESEMRYKRLTSRTRGPFATSDGHLAVVVYSNKHWDAFTAFVGEPDLIRRDPRFASQESRTIYAEDMGRFIAEKLKTRTTQDWLDSLVKLDIPASPVNSMEDLLVDPHLEAVDMFETVEHPTEGPIKIARFPVKFAKSPASIRRHAPNLGEHTDDVLGAGFGLETKGAAE
jgi:crotonobetainyl-CoA:carnitine CoA-transferase CaiB-like acyl-CoA transferase